MQERLRALQREAKRTHGYNWDPRPRRKDQTTGSEQPSNRLTEAVLVTAVIAGTVGVWVVGLTTIIRDIVPWLINHF